MEISKSKSTYTFFISLVVDEFVKCEKSKWVETGLFARLDPDKYIFPDVSLSIKLSGLVGSRTRFATST